MHDAAAGSNPNTVSIDFVARANTSELLVHQATGRVLEIQATTARQPNIVSFDHVSLPYPPSDSSTYWHQSLRDKTKMGSSQCGSSHVSVTSGANALLGDMTPRAVTTAVAAGSVTSWEHHSILPDIVEGFGPDETYKRAGEVHSLGGNKRLFLYRQDEESISDAASLRLPVGQQVPNTDGSSCGEHAHTDAASQRSYQSNGNKNNTDQSHGDGLLKKKPDLAVHFLSREQTEILMLQAEQTIISSRAPPTDELTVYGENVIKAKQRHRRKQARREAQLPEFDDAKHAEKAHTGTVSIRIKSEAFSSGPMQKVKIMNVEFPRFSRRRPTKNPTDADVTEAKATENVDRKRVSLTPRNSCTSLISKHVSPATPPTSAQRADVMSNDAVDALVTSYDVAGSLADGNTLATDDVTTTLERSVASIAGGLCVTCYTLSAIA